MYIPSTLPFALWKKEKWKRPLDTEIRNMIKNKSILWRRYAKCWVRRPNAGSISDKLQQ